MNDQDRDFRSMLIERYQACAMALWVMFEKDPLPEGDPAHGMLERLESLIKHNLLVPRTELHAADIEVDCLAKRIITLEAKLAASEADVAAMRAALQRIAAGKTGADMTHPLGAGTAMATRFIGTAQAAISATPAREGGAK